MKSTTLTLSTIFTVILTTLILSSPHSAYAEKLPPIALVSHKDAPFSDVSLAALARLFLQQSPQISGNKAKAINMADEELKFPFLIALTGKSQSKIESHFVKLEVTGEGSWPPEVDDPSALIKLIVRSKKVIGWFPLSDYEALNSKLKARIKILSVEGKKPDAADYPLKQ